VLREPITKALSIQLKAKSEPQMARPTDRSKKHGGTSRVARQREKGQSLVEVAFLLPILILLLAVVIDASRAFDALIVLTNAVRQGARYASLEPNPSLDQIKQMVVDDVVGSGTNVTNMSDFSADHVSVDVDPGVAVTVTASYEFPLWFGGILGMPTLTLEKTAVMRHTEESPGG
jgi:Flp pilus assembly protein TadG